MLCRPGAPTAQVSGAGQLLEPHTVSQVEADRHPEKITGVIDAAATPRLGLTP